MKLQEETYLHKLLNGLRGTYRHNSKLCNRCILLSTFPDELKTADTIPVSKTPDVADKTNYRPITLLPIIEMILYLQVETVANKIFFTKTMWIQRML